MLDCRPLVLFACATTLVVLEQASAQAQASGLDVSLLREMKARAIGPAVVGGRIGAVAGVPGDPTVIWAGASAGGTS